MTQLTSKQIDNATEVLMDTLFDSERFVSTVQELAYEQLGLSDVDELSDEDAEKVQAAFGQIMQELFAACSRR